MRHFIRRLGWKRLAIGGAVLVVGWFLLSLVSDNEAGVVAEQNSTRKVEVQSVRDLTLQTTSLTIAGTVTSKSEATVRTERAGEVTGVYYALGNSVTAGAIVAEMENASERAAVLQAEGAVDAAEASLNKTTGGSRTEQQEILRATLTGAQEDAVAALLGAYASVENTVRVDIDQMFSSPNSPQPHFNVVSSETQLVQNAQNGRVVVGSILTRHAVKSSSLSPNEDLSAELIKTDEELRTVRTFLDAVIGALNKGIATQGVTESQIATYKSDASGARTTITTALSSVSAAREALTVAEKNLEQGVTGGQPEDVAAAEAALKQAQGGLAAARANLEKTIIRAPISGTINSLTLKHGDYVAVSSPVLTVANNGALEVVAYITQNDIVRIAVGDPVTLEGGVIGTVTRIAPALDPITKKIEVRIGIPANTKELVNGQSTSVRFEKTASAPTATITTPLMIPISALKIGAENIVVFTVDAEGKLVAHPVTLGTLRGDRVEISSGLEADMLIVTDARGLQAGEVVEVQ